METIDPGILVYALLMALFGCLAMAGRIRRLDDRLESMAVRIQKENFAALSGRPFATQSDHELLRYWP